MATTTKNVNTTTRYDHPVNVVFQKQCLKTLKPKLLYAILAEKVGMPKNAGEVVKWRRLAKFGAQTTPLNEIGEPTPLLGSKTDISASVKPYGAVVVRSKWLNMTGLGQEQQMTVDELIDARDLTVDTLSKDVLAGAASSTTCSHGTGTATFLNAEDIDAVVQALLNEDCEPPYPILKAGRGVGTTPIEQAFPVIANVKCWTKLKAVSGFVPVASYPAQTNLLPGEVGSIGMTRWCLTSNGYYDGSTYYYATVLSRGAYGNVEIDGSKEPIIRKEIGVINPVQHIGWYMTHVSKILDEIRLHNLKFTI
ncbi:MAG: N4-gp56 family major capsid protein [Candidatus Micrarchaeia archaeon]|jgi:N4-gp56 family major capsid protein